MTPSDPTPVRPYLCDRVHAALVELGRPITRGELMMFLNGRHKADYQAAIDALVADGLAIRGEEGPVRGRWQTVATYRAADRKGNGG
jgi:hypothetical protein